MTGAADGLGFAPLTPKSTKESIYELLVIPRIQRCKRGELGWPEKWPATRFSGGSSSGILGVALQSSGGGAAGGYGLMRT